MRQSNIIALMVILASILIGAIIWIVLLQGENAINSSPKEEEVSLIGEPAEETLDPFCPSKLLISTYVITQNTKDKSDDEVYISILNPDPREYGARIFVNKEYEAEGIIPAVANLDIKSETMTSWWTNPASQEEDAEVETIDIVRTNTFTIDVRVEGCEKQIALLTPDSPLASAEGAISAGGGGGGGGGAAGGSIIKITRPVDQNIND